MIDLAQPWALLALASLPLIVLLHALRPTRRRVELSSTWLWQEALRERRRGLGLEKLLRNLSLLLLLLFALLTSLALADPRWLTRSADHGDIVVVLDTSASMQAEEAGGTRFELARRDAEALIGELPGDGRLLLMTSGRHAVLRSAFESDKRVLREQLAALAPGDEAGRPRAALALALSLLRNRDRGRVYFLTDGAFDERVDFGAVDIDYRLVGSAQDNIAITRFDVRPEPDAEDRFQVLVTVRSQARETMTVPVSVTLERQVLVEETVRLEPGASRTLVWPFRGRASGRAEAVIDVDDALPADDRAWAVPGGDENLRILLLSEGSLYLESALRALPGAVVTRLPEVPELYLAEEVRRQDVVVIDRLPAPELPPGSYLLVDTVPPGLPFAAAGRVAQPTLAGHSNSALLADIDLSGLRIDEAGRIEVDDTRADLQRLFWSDQTVLALAGIDGPRRFVYLGFDPARSSLPLRAAFPLFVRQGVEWLRPGLRRDSPTQVRAGETYLIRVPAGRGEVIVRDPDNEAAVYDSDGGTLAFDATTHAGIYQVSFGYDAGAVQRYFAVNLADERESDLRPRAALASTAGTPAEREIRGEVTLPLWPYLTALAMLALLLEWCLPARRPRRA